MSAGGGFTAGLSVTVTVGPVLKRFGVRALVGAVLVSGCAAAPASARVPAGWLGVGLSDFSLSPQVDLDSEAGVMSRAGIQSVRIPVFWDRSEPVRGVYRLD